MASERTTGLRAVLSAAPVYRTFQRLIGSANVRRELVRRYVRPRPGDDVLDIGCGPADVVPLLPEVRYVGMDLNPRYVEAARERYGDRATFFQGSLADVTTESLGGPFDIVLAIGVLHHLDDDVARNAIRLARGVLRDDGRLVTIDPSLVAGQHRVARAVIRRDRGANVRGPEGYVALARSAFDHVEVNTHHDLLNIPYTHAVMVCTLDGPRADATG